MGSVTGFHRGLGSGPSLVFHESLLNGLGLKQWLMLGLGEFAWLLGLLPLGSSKKSSELEQFGSGSENARCGFQRGRFLSLAKIGLFG